MEALRIVEPTDYLEDVIVYPSKAIANEFIKRSSYTVSPMKLQKLIYFAHGWCLKLTENALIEENFEAWQYGPVVSEIYHEFKSFGNRNINRLAYDETNKPYAIEKDDGETSKLIDAILAKYGPSDALALSAKTHEAGAPWDEVYNRLCLPNHEISDKIIREKFKP